MKKKQPLRNATQSNDGNDPVEVRIVVSNRTVMVVPYVISADDKTRLVPDWGWMQNVTRVGDKRRLP